MNQINPAAMAAIATLVAMTLSQGHQPPRNRSRSLSFWGRLRYRTYRHPLVTFGIGPPFSGKPRGGFKHKHLILRAIYSATCLLPRGLAYPF